MITISWEVNTLLVLDTALAPWSAESAFKANNREGSSLAREAYAR